MFKKTLLLIFLVSFIITIGSAVFAENDKNMEIIKIKAWTIGPDNPSIYRDKNLITAVERLNSVYEAAGINTKIEIETDFWTQEKTKYWQRILLAFQSKDAPDIIVNGHEKIGSYAAADYILPLNKYKEEYSNLLNDVYESLWASTLYKGNYYGVPQDTEDRMMYFRKDILKEYGYSDSDIEKLKEDVKNGDFTLVDMAELSKKVKDAGLVEWGIWHRPSSGVDWFQWYLSFGGKLQDPETGKLVFDKTAYRDYFQYYRDIAFKWKVTPSSMTDYAWTSIHKGFLEGKVLFWQGGSYHIAEYQQVYGKTKEEVKEQFDFILQPKGNDRGKPNTMSHPLVYMINKRSKHPDIAFEILALASAPDLNAKHALFSGHLAIRKGEAELNVYKENEHMRAATKILPYTITAPNHVSWPKYQEIIYTTVKGVQSGNLKVEQAIDFALNQLKRNIEDDLIVVE